MKTKRRDIINRLSLAWWALSNRKDFMLIEECERCGSHIMENSAKKRVINEDGTISYYAKYFCRKCGASCYVHEIWEDNAVLEFDNKKEDAKNE